MTKTIKPSKTIRANKRRAKLKAKHTGGRERGRPASLQRRDDSAGGSPTSANLWSQAFVDLSILGAAVVGYQRTRDSDHRAL
jgi:hypothetical protein